MSTANMEGGSQPGYLAVMRVAKAKAFDGLADPDRNLLGQGFQDWSPPPGWKSAIRARRDDHVRWERDRCRGAEASESDRWVARHLEMLDGGGDLTDRQLGLPEGVFEVAVDLATVDLLNERLTMLRLLVGRMSTDDQKKGLYERLIEALDEYRENYRRLAGHGVSSRLDDPYWIARSKEIIEDNPLATPPSDWLPSFDSGESRKSKPRRRKYLPSSNPLLRDIREALPSGLPS